MNDQVQKFNQQAADIATREFKLFSNSSLMFDLYKKCEDIQKDQIKLDENFNKLESNQIEITDTLNELEANVNQLCHTQNDMHFINSDGERERVYQLAISLNAQLNTMDDVIQNHVTEINSRQDTPVDDDVASVIQILNVHLTLLQNMYQHANTLNSKITEVGNLLHQQRGAQRQFQKTSTSFF